MARCEDGYRPKWIKCDILQTCEFVHECNTGSMELTSLDDYEMARKGLQWVVDNWQPSINKDWEEVENRIKELCIAVLKEKPFFTPEKEII